MGRDEAQHERRRVPPKQPVFQFNVLKSSCVNNLRTHEDRRLLWFVLAGLRDGTGHAFLLLHAARPVLTPSADKAKTKTMAKSLKDRPHD